MWSVDRLSFCFIHTRKQHFQANRIALLAQNKLIPFLTEQFSNWNDWSATSLLLWEKAGVTTSESYYRAIHWWLNHQRPLKVDRDCHPRRQCNPSGLNLQLENGNGHNHTYCPLDCLERWQSDHTCHHSHMFSELCTKCKMEIPDMHVTMYDIHLSRLFWCMSWTYWSRSRQMVELTGWRAK